MILFTLSFPRLDLRFEGSSMAEASNFLIWLPHSFWLLLLYMHVLDIPLRHDPWLFEVMSSPLRHDPWLFEVMLSLLFTYPLEL